MIWRVPRPAPACRRRLSGCPGCLRRRCVSRLSRDLRVRPLPVSENGYVWIRAAVTPKNAPNSPRESDAWRFLEAAPTAVVVTDVELDRPGPRIVYVNPAFETMTGFSREHERHHLEQLVTRFVDAAPDVVIVLDEDLHIGRINAGAARMFGWSNAEVQGTHVDVLIPPGIAASTTPTPHASPWSRCKADGWADGRDRWSAPRRHGISGRGIRGQDR